jgi:hypothetical protein
VLFCEFAEVFGRGAGDGLRTVDVALARADEGNRFSKDDEIGLLLSSLGNERSELRAVRWC